MADTMRLDRFLSEMGAGTRSEIREACRKKQVLVNGEIERKSDRRIDTLADRIIYKGEPVAYAALEYYMLNKPAGVVTATEDRHQRTVLDLLTVRTRKDLFPVGRLDRDTEGLLLITNDGPLCQRLLSPKHHVAKTYQAVVRGAMTPDMIPLFREGLDIGDEKPTLPAELEILSCRLTEPDGGAPDRQEPEPYSEARETESEQRKSESDRWESEIRLTITEGRFHQVKRMVRAVGCEVTALKRLSMGSLTLDPSLAPGEFRPLTPEEIAQLQGTNGDRPHLSQK